MIENLKKEDQIEQVNPKKIEDGLRDTISDLFNERDQKHLAEDQKHLDEGNASFKQAEEATHESRKDLSTSVAKVKKDEKSSSEQTSAGEVNAESELKSLTAELEKTRKTILENQKYGRQNAQRLKSALKQTQLLMESGALSQEEAQSLLASLESGDGEVAQEREVSPYDSHPFGKILKVANAELVNLRKYSDDELLDDKIKAFDYFLSVAPQEDIAESFEVLNDLIEDPVKLAKQMLNIGKRYYDESYKDIASSGGIAQYIKIKQEEIEKLNKSIDKLTKKLAHYEDYDQPRYRIKEMGESHQPPASRDPSSDVFDERDKDDIRRQKRLAVNRPL